MSDPVNNEIDPDTLLKELNQSFDAFQQMASDELHLYMYQVAEAWHARFPKRALVFIDSYFGPTWKVDGRDVGDFDCRYESLFEPLETAADWYAKAADTFSASVQTIELTPKTPERLVPQDS